MPRAKPSVLTGTAELNAMIEHVAPAILGLLADGVPRTKATIVAALAGRHDAEDVRLALIRLAVTGRVVEAGGKYALAAVEPYRPAALGDVLHREAVGKTKRVSRP
jgi:hypothetical protein